MRITVSIIIINIAIFILQLIYAPFTDMYALTPTLALSGDWWQFFTYMFLHGGVAHVMINMFVLFIFGVVIEHALGWKKYIALYVLAGLGSACLYILLMGVSDIPMLGASGAVFGVMAAYGFMFPKERIIIFPIPYPIPAFVAILAIAGLELFLGVTGLEPGIANFGHLGGLLTGLALTWFWKRRKPKGDIDAERNYEFFWE